MSKSIADIFNDIDKLFKNAFGTHIKDVPKKKRKKTISKQEKDFKKLYPLRDFDKFQNKHKLK